MTNIATTDTSTGSGLPWREATANDPTPNWRTHGRFNDDRRHWLMLPSTARYEHAKMVGKHACLCGKAHDADLYEDGTLRCDQTDTFIVAPKDNAELWAMRMAFEDAFIQLVRATELS